MEYQEFIENVTLLLRREMGPDYEVKTRDVTKNNGIHLTGVIMMRESDKMSPTIYLEEPYRMYREEGRSLQGIVTDIVQLYREQMANISFDVDRFRDFGYVRNHIFYKLINYERNPELLADVPHFKWCDLAVVFYYSLAESRQGRASILIRNSHLDLWRQSAEELGRIAHGNMRRGMPELFIPMRQMVKEITGSEPPASARLSMYVLTNRSKLNGAAAMLYSEQMKGLADRLETDLLILPSSVHEVILLPDDHEQPYDFYRRMVREVNTTQVDPEEILSYRIYRYSRKKAEIEEISG